MTIPTFEAMKNAVVAGEIEEARQLARQAVEGGLDLVQVVERGFAEGIREVGDQWEAGEYFLPELVQGAEAMKAAMSVINPALAASRGGASAKGVVVIGTVRGDLHDIGKTLVATLLEANGYEVHDLGSDVPVEAFVAKAREVGADVVAGSALLTTTMQVQKALVDAIRSEGLRARVLVGGSPTTPAWAREIGAVHAENAQRAVSVVEGLLG